MSVDNGKNCYQLYLDKKKWSDAKQYCKQYDNAELVTITDGFEQAFMNLLTFVKTQADPWIGLTKVITIIITNNSQSIVEFTLKASDNVLNWSDSWPVSYVNWGENSFNLSSSNNCFYIQSKNGLWNSTSCDEPKSFICKITKEPIPVITQPPPGYCRENWKEFGAYCYKFDTNLRSFGDAKFDCYQQGAYLVTIHSPAEVEFVTSVSMTSTILSGPIWIGLEKNQLTSISFFNFK